MPFVALLSIELHFPGARSLKDKRTVLRSLKDRLRKLNVAFAEVDHQDLWQRARLGVVAISTTRDGADRSLGAVVDEIERHDPDLIVDTVLEYLA